MNSLIMIKLPFYRREHLQIFPTSPASKTCALPLDFTLALERDLKNIFYYQRDVENCTDQALDFLLFHGHEWTQGIFRPVISGQYIYITGL